MRSIERVSVTYEERNYFNDYDEFRSDRSTCPDSDTIKRAIDKMCRRFKAHGKTDCLWVVYNDNTAYRLIYDLVDYETYEHPVFGVMCNGGRYALMLRHYNVLSTESSDKEFEVTPSKAKRLILGELEGGN